MKVKILEKRNYNLETVEDMVKALMEVPKGYLLHPTGMKCGIAVDNYHECVYLDDENWIDEYDYELQENIKQTGDWNGDVDDKKLEPFSFGYVWESTEDENGVYTYYKTIEQAKLNFDLIDGVDKTYGKAIFINGCLEPVETIGTTL